LYKSTILRLAQSLENHGYLGRNEHTGYHVGPSVLRLAGLYQAALRPDEVIMPALQALVDETAESAAFQVPAGDRRLCVYRVDSPHRLRDYLRPGDTLPMDRGAAGKVITAFTQPYDARYSAWRKKVVLSTANETADGMAALAAPVLEMHNRIFGAVVLSGAATRFDKRAIARFEPALRAAARKITAALGGDAGIFDLPTEPKAKRPA
jgi:DNA-binding IclR family transcriptional regulator